MRVLRGTVFEVSGPQEVFDAKGMLAKLGGRAMTAKRYALR